MNHEQSLADIFRRFMETEAPRHGCCFHSFSLDGQDRDTGADYVLTDADRFAIVEFKYSERDLVSEKAKPRRFTLCQKLAEREDMQLLHDACHFVSWSQVPQGKVMTNIYRHEICNQAVFGLNCGLSVQRANSTTRSPASKFAADFFNPNGAKSLSLTQFEAYLEWVMTKTSGLPKAKLELVAHNPLSNDLALVQLNSIADAQNWVRTHIAPPTPPNRHAPGGVI